MSTSTVPVSQKQSFFTIGGTLPANAPSYVERNADRDLLAHLSAGEFCYVLTSRQMGKSSLMVRTASSLRQAGTKVALLDLTQIGHNVTLEQWYDGLLIRLGSAFNLEDEIEDFWNSGDAAVRRMGAMQRWMSAIRQVIVKSIPGNIVIFVDEIDFVRRLPFSSDEFFAGIRQVYNERTSDPELKRLTFCVVGVASPSDLINVSNTPFNIGHRIELTDFTPEEAERFVDGLRPPDESHTARKLLKRVLWWTGGHPYLTQRLCATVSSFPDVVDSSGVDRLCHTLFLALLAADTTDDNLQYVRDRVEKKSASTEEAASGNLLFVRDRAVMMRDSDELIGLLDLYSRVRSGKHVPRDDANPLIEVLRLAGLVAVRDNRLVVRNRIYRKVFDKRWIHVTMPGAELRRQRAAYRRGAIRMAGIAATILLAFTVLILAVGDEGQQTAFESYSAKMIQVQRAFDDGDFASGTDLLRQTSPLIRSQDWLRRHFVLRSFIERRIYLYALLNLFDHKVDRHFEWGYMQARSDGNAATAYLGFLAEVRSVAISPDGTLLAAAGADSTVRIFDISHYGYSANPGDPPVVARALAILDNNGTPNSWLALVPCLQEPPSNPSQEPPCHSINWQLRHELYSRDKKDSPGKVSSYEKNFDVMQATLPLPGILSVQFSPDGKWLAIGTGNWHNPNRSGAVYLWDVNSPDVVKTVTTQHTAGVNAVVFRPLAAPKPGGAQITELATASDDGTAKFFDIAPDGEISPNKDAPFNSLTACPESRCGGIKAAAYSPDGRTFAMAFGDGSLWVRGWAKPIMEDVSGLVSLTFYDGHQILLGSRDGHVLDVDLLGSENKDKPTKPQTLLETGQGLVTSLTVSADQNLLVTTGSSGTAVVWELIKDEHYPFPILAHHDPVILRGERGVDFSAAMTERPESAETPNERRYLIVSGDADVSKGLPGGRVSFWVQQRMPGHTAQKTWESQPAVVPADGVVPALAFSPKTQTCDDPILNDPGHPDLYVAPNDRWRVSKWIAMVRGVSRTSGNTEDSAIYFIPLNPCTGKPTEPIASTEIAVPTNGNAGTALAWSSDGDFVASAARNGSVLLWDVSGLPDTEKLKHPKSLNIPSPGSERLQIKALSFSPDGTLAAAVNFGTSHGKEEILKGEILIWKPGQYMAPPEVISPSNTSSPSLETLAFSADGSWLAVCDSDKNVEIWTEANLSGLGEPLHLDTTVELNKGQFLDPQAAFSTIAFSPDGQWLAAGNSAREVAVWSTGGGWNRVQGDFTTGSIEGVSPKEYRLPRPPHANASINAIAFSTDNEVLAYGTADGIIHLWDVTSQLPLPMIAGHSRGVLSLAFSPGGLNGSCLASGSNDETLRFDCQMNQEHEKLEILHSVLNNSYDRPDIWDWIDFAQ